MKARILGRIQLPRGLVKAARTARPSYWVRRLRNWEVLDLPVSEHEDLQPFADNVYRRVTACLGNALPRNTREDSVLWYRAVRRHTDDWLSQRFEGMPRSCAVAFLHVCIQGTTRLRVSNETLTLSRGDVFLLNPNTYHEVLSSTLCCTLCYVVPLKLANSLPSIEPCHAL